MTKFLQIFILAILLNSCMIILNELTANYDEINTKTIEILIFNMTNELRTGLMLPGLKRNENLDKLALYHSKNMVRHDFFSHVDHEGLRPYQRALKPIFKLGKNNMISENIANTPWHSNVIGFGNTQSNYKIAQCIFQQWKNSDGHYKNMIGDHTEIGIGVDFNSSYYALSTQVFR